VEKKDELVIKSTVCSLAARAYSSRRELDDDANEMRPATAQRLAGIFPTGTVAETTCQLNAWPQVIQYGLCGENTYVRKVFGDSKKI
jgi:hypothetical protein